MNKNSPIQDYKKKHDLNQIHIFLVPSMYNIHIFQIAYFYS